MIFNVPPLYPGTLETWSLVLHGSATQPIRLRNQTQPGGQPLPPKVTVAPPRATSPPLTNSQSQVGPPSTVFMSNPLLKWFLDTFVFI